MHHSAVKKRSTGCPVRSARAIAASWSYAKATVSVFMSAAGTVSADLLGTIHESQPLSAALASEQPARLNQARRVGRGLRETQQSGSRLASIGDIHSLPNIHDQKRWIARLATARILRTGIWDILALLTSRQGKPPYQVFSAAKGRFVMPACRSERLGSRGHLGRLFSISPC